MQEKTLEKFTCVLEVIPEHKDIYDLLIRIMEDVQCRYPNIVQVAKQQEQDSFIVGFTSEKLAVAFITVIKQSAKAIGDVTMRWLVRKSI